MYPSVYQQRADAANINAGRLRLERDALRSVLSYNARKGCMACDGAGYVTIEGQHAMCLCVKPAQKLR